MVHRGFPAFLNFTFQPGARLHALYSIFPEGADRVRKRPGVIFGSDGLEGCEHAVFEILSNSIDF